MWSHWFCSGGGALTASSTYTSLLLGLWPVVSVTEQLCSFYFVSQIYLWGWTVCTHLPPGRLWPGLLHPHVLIQWQRHGHVFGDADGCPVLCSREPGVCVWWFKKGTSSLMRPDVVREFSSSAPGWKVTHGLRFASVELLYAWKGHAFMAKILIPNNVLLHFHVQMNKSTACVSCCCTHLCIGKYKWNSITTLFTPNEMNRISFSTLVVGWLLVEKALDLIWRQSTYF